MTTWLFLGALPFSGFHFPGDTFSFEKIPPWEMKDRKWWRVFLGPSSFPALSFPRMKEADPFRHEEKRGSA